MDKEYLKDAARAIEAKMPDNHGFILLAMTFGPDGRLNYISNINREDAIKALKEFLFHVGAAEEWMQHVR